MQRIGEAERLAHGPQRPERQEQGFLEIEHLCLDIHFGAADGACRLVTRRRRAHTGIGRIERVGLFEIALLCGLIGSAHQPCRPLRRFPWRMFQRILEMPFAKPCITLKRTAVSQPASGRGNGQR